MELVTVCAWCPPIEIPAGKEVSHNICRKHLIEKFPDQAERVLARLQAKTAVELANPFLAQQTF